MICMCTLTGTAACKTCWNNPNGTGRSYTFITGTTTVTDTPQITYVPERTCRNVGYYIDGTRFKCSECGYNGWTKWAKDGEDRVPNYCPNCGARVTPKCSETTPKVVSE